MLRFALFVALLFPSFVFADPPKAVITGPTEGVPGDLIELDSSESIGSKLKWYVEPLRFADGKPTFKISKDGTTVQLATRSGSYRVELIVSNEEGPDRAIWNVTIGGGSPPPPPPPFNPDPPPLPAGRFGLANFVRSQILANVPKEKRGPAATFSGVFSSVSAQIAAGTIPTPAAAMAKAKAMNQQSVSDPAVYNFWKTAVNDALAAKLTSLITANAVSRTNMDDWKDAFAEIATGYAAGSN